MRAFITVVVVRKNVGNSFRPPSIDSSRLARGIGRFPDLPYILVFFVGIVVLRTVPVVDAQIPNKYASLRYTRFVAQPQGQQWHAATAAGQEEGQQQQEGAEATAADAAYTRSSGGGIS